MPFREKSAWVTLIAILLVSALFLLHAPRLAHPGPWDFYALLACIGALPVVIETVGVSGILRLRYPEDARTPMDERERLINLKATRLASGCYVLAFVLNPKIVKYDAAPHRVLPPRSLTWAARLSATASANCVSRTAR